MGIAQNARIGRAACYIFVYKVINNKIPELVPDIQYEVRESVVYGRCAGIIKGIQVTATGFFLAGAGRCIIPGLHGDTHHFIPLFMEHQGGNGTIYTAAHRYQNLTMSAHC